MEKQKQSDPIPPPPQSRKIPGLVLGLGFVLQSNTTLGLSIKPCSPPPIPESVTTPPIIFINYNKSGSLIVGGFQHYTTAQRLPHLLHHPVSSSCPSPPTTPYWRHKEDCELYLYPPTAPSPLPPRQLCPEAEPEKIPVVSPLPPRQLCPEAEPVPVIYNPVWLRSASVGLIFTNSPRNIYDKISDTIVKLQANTESDKCSPGN